MDILTPTDKDPKLESAVPSTASRALLGPVGEVRAKAPETGETRETPREASQATRESAERTHIDRVEVLVIGDLRMAKDYLQELKNYDTQHDREIPVILEGAGIRSTT